MVWLDDELNSDRWKRYSSYIINQRIWLADQLEVVEYERICDWLANRECLFSREASIKIDVFKVRWEKISDVHTEEISPRTKASTEKASPLKKKKTE